MVRVLAIADEEAPAAFQRAENLEVDVLMSAGDLDWSYAEQVAETLGVPAVSVPGNHDRAGAGPQGFVAADRSVVEVAGLRIAGLGGCVRYNGESPHQHTQEQFHADAVRLIEASDGPVDVLLTHAPPLGVGDHDDPAHVGIEALHQLIEALNPTWHLHGHIHPYGRHKPDRVVAHTTIRNVIPWTVMDIERKSS